MPRANRYIIGGNIYHLTHRCHDRQFLLKFARDRNNYRQRLLQAIRATGLSLLTYNITSNHVHLIVFADDEFQVAECMQQAAGESARDYNRRKARSGAFWEGRYYATMVESGEYLWECLKYVELNMVRCRAVDHPCHWELSGYAELMGWRKRNRLLDPAKLMLLLQTSAMDEFRTHFNSALEKAIIHDELRRQANWTDAIAVGSQTFVQQIEQRIRGRQQLVTTEQGGAWVLREEHGAISDPKNQPIDQFQVSFLS